LEKKGRKGLEKRAGIPADRYYISLFTVYDGVT